MLLLVFNAGTNAKFNAGTNAKFLQNQVFLESFELVLDTNI